MTTMIRENEPDLVSIITPPMLRTAVVEPAIAAGARAILIEKPLALTPSEAERLTAWGRDRLIAVNTQYAWMPHWQRFWPMLKNGDLGELRFLRASTQMNIMEQGPHVLDLALTAARLGGLPAPQWVFAAASGLERFGKLPVPKYTEAIVGLGEARLQLSAGPTAPPTGDPSSCFNIQCEIIGTRGRLHVPLTGGWSLWRDGHFETGPTGWPEDDQSAQPGLFTALRDAILQGNWREFPARVEAAKQVSDVMFACYASALNREVIKLPAELSDEVVSGLEILAGR
jgi:predicted dehydrogenase